MCTFVWASFFFSVSLVKIIFIDYHCDSCSEQNNVFHTLLLDADNYLIGDFAPQAK